MKSKYLNKISFIDDERFWNREDVSPYLFITSMDTKGSSTAVELRGIDLRGKDFKKNLLINWVYQNIHIQDEPHLYKEFIKNIFERRNK